MGRNKVIHVLQFYFLKPSTYNSTSNKTTSKCGKIQPKIFSTQKQYIIVECCVPRKRKMQLIYYRYYIMSNLMTFIGMP
jgi:hypothetical protein